MDGVASWYFVSISSVGADVSKTSQLEEIPLRVLIASPRAIHVATSGVVAITTPNPGLDCFRGSHMDSELRVILRPAETWSFIILAQPTLCRKLLYLTMSLGVAR